MRNLKARLDKSLKNTKKPKTVQTTLRLPAHVHKGLKVLAKKHRLSMTKLLTKILELSIGTGSR